MNRRFRIKDPMARPPRPGTLLSPTLGVPVTGGLYPWLRHPPVPGTQEWGEERRVEVVAGEGEDTKNSEKIFFVSLLPHRL